MEDEKIIQLFFQRNEQAVVETDRTYGRKLYVLSNNILNNREDAEESVSDTYMEAWKTIPPKHPTCFYAFLAAICRNLSFNRLDWRMAAKRNAEVVALTQEMEMCIPDRRQEDEFDRRELRRILEELEDYRGGNYFAIPGEYLELSVEDGVVTAQICLCDAWPCRMNVDFFRRLVTDYLSEWEILRRELGWQ